MFATKFTVARDFHTDWYQTWKQKLNLGDHIHRKCWEIATICETLASAGMLNTNKKGIGYGVGNEPLLTLFTKMGCTILATDGLPSTWSTMNDQFHTINQTIETRIVDMNWIQGAVQPNHYDFSWSICSMDHCGSTWLTKRFLLNQMNCLKKGGIATHTAEYTINTELPKIGTTTWLTWEDILDIQQLMTACGHHPAPIDWFIGDTLEDHIIDKIPYNGKIHIKCETHNRWGTCVIITARKQHDHEFWVPLDEQEARTKIHQQSHQQSHQHDTSRTPRQNPRTPRRHQPTHRRMPPHIQPTHPQTTRR